MSPVFPKPVIIVANPYSSDAVRELPREDSSVIGNSISHYRIIDKLGAGGNRNLSKLSAGEFSASASQSDQTGNYTGNRRLTSVQCDNVSI